MLNVLGLHKHAKTGTDELFGPEEDVSVRIATIERFQDELLPGHALIAVCFDDLFRGELHKLLKAENVDIRLRATLKLKPWYEGFSLRPLCIDIPGANVDADRVDRLARLGTGKQKGKSAWKRKSGRKAGRQYHWFTS